MKALVDLDRSLPFAIAVSPSYGGPPVLEGLLVDGPQGWGEFSPPADATPVEDVRWLTAALEPGTVGFPDAVRGRVPVSITVPAGLGPEDTHTLITESSCRAVDVIVATGPLGDDIARIEAARDALGPDGAIRCAAGGRWDGDTAAKSLAALDKAAHGLEFVVQPCATVDELAAVRRRVAIAVGVEPHRGHDPADLSAVADLAVLHTAPLGGVRRALRVAERTGLPCVVFASLATGVGMSSGLALAGALPELPYACLLDRSQLHGDVTSAWYPSNPVDGHLPVAPMPPAPDPAAVAQHPLRDAARVAWWHDRLRAAAAAA